MTKPKSKRGSRMNGDHKEIFDEITDLKVAVVGIKKDTKHIIKTFDDHLKRFEKVNDRVRTLEAFRWKTIGATSVIGGVGFLTFIKAIGLW